MAYQGNGAAPFPMPGKWAFDGTGKIKRDVTPHKGMNQDGLPGRCPENYKKALFGVTEYKLTDTELTLLTVGKPVLFLLVTCRFFYHFYSNKLISRI